jgi:DDE domain
MVVAIGGRRLWLWRAVDSEGEILDLLVQPKRDKIAAVRLMRKLLKKQGYAPDVLVTDKLRSYACARRELGLSSRHEQGLRKNNRAENSHQVVRRREHKMQPSSTTPLWTPPQAQGESSERPALSRVLTYVRPRMRPFVGRGPVWRRSRSWSSGRKDSYRSLRNRTEVGVPWCISIVAVCSGSPPRRSVQQLPPEPLRDREARGSSKQPWPALPSYRLKQAAWW